MFSFGSLLLLVLSVGVRRGWCGTTLLTTNDCGKRYRTDAIARPDFWYVCECGAVHAVVFEDVSWLGGGCCLSYCI